MKRLSFEFIQSFIRALLRPIVRYCVRRSFSFPEFSKLAKQLYFEAGEEYIRAANEPASVSKISALTGIDRRDIARFHKDGAFFVRKENLLSRVMGQWEHGTRYSRGRGNPKPLSCEGIESEFFGLVQSVSKDLNPYTVMSELERVGAVERSGNTLKLASQVYVPRDNLEDAMRILSHDTQDLLTVIEENVITKPNNPHLHIRTQYDNLSPQALSKIQEWFLEKGEKIHQEVRQYLSRHDKDLNPKVKEGGGRAVLTSFAYVENPNEDDS